MKDDLMMARIRDAEHAQSVAELNQKISRLELKVSSLALLFLNKTTKNNMNPQMEPVGLFLFRLPRTYNLNWGPANNIDFAFSGELSSCQLISHTLLTLVVEFGNFPPCKYIS